MPSDLALIDRARRDLARANSVGEAQEVRAKAAALADYLKRRGGAEEAARSATAIRLRAERRIGEMLAETVSAGNPNCSPGEQLPGSVNRKQSHQWQRIAAIPEPEFEEELAKPEPTTAAMLKRWKKWNAAQNGDDDPDPDEYESGVVRDLQTLLEAGERFGCIYADPPWQYGNNATRAAADDHYTTMTLDDIAGLPIAELAADDAHLHLWTTNAFLPESFAVMEAWGFEYRSVFVWVKPQMGIGNYWRVSHEFMLFGKRGRAPFRSRDLMSWGQFDRTAHSSKPEAVRGMVERASPGPYLELFGRTVAEGWTVWGNQIQRDLLVRELRER